MENNPSNGFTAISCFIFVSPEMGGCIYTNFPVFEGLHRLGLTKCVK